jgi:hypothetical protein
LCYGFGEMRGATLTLLTFTTLPEWRFAAASLSVSPIKRLMTRRFSLCETVRRMRPFRRCRWERDRTRTDRVQGYRVHINPTGSLALHECLPAPLFDMFTRTCGRPTVGICFVTEQMKVLLALDGLNAPTRFGGDGAAQHGSVSRITLRRVLLSGLEDAVHFGKTFVRYEESSLGHIVAQRSLRNVWAEDASHIARDGIDQRLRAGETSALSMATVCGNRDRLENFERGKSEAMPSRPNIDRALERLRELRMNAAGDQKKDVELQVLYKKLDHRTWIYCICDILIELLAPNDQPIEPKVGNNAAEGIKEDSRKR